MRLLQVLLGNVAMGSAGRMGAADLIDGLATAAAAIFAFLALDDITTDAAASFNLEYACLLACTGWSAILVARLARRGRGVLAWLRAGFLLAALWAHTGIGPGTTPTWEGEYVAITGALVGMYGSG